VQFNLIENILLKDRSTDRPDGNAMLDVYRTVVSDADAIYCSGPLTSGRRAIEWYNLHPSVAREIDSLSSELRKEFTKAVVDENAKQLKSFVSDLRKTTQRVVIDPSAIQESSWSQKEWLEFWCNVISGFVQTVVLLPDWQYSKGASVECLFALRKNKEVYLHDNSAVGYAHAKECIESAAAELKANGFGSGHSETVFRLVEERLHGS
jgi:hypothetical protein